MIKLLKMNSDHSPNMVRNMNQEELNSDEEDDLKFTRQNNFWQRVSQKLRLSSKKTFQKKFNNAIVRIFNIIIIQNI